ncbi:MAG TPA: response regulator [Opitutaceae bacterium]|nr:response regulator [Lacunisphaera sp.]HWA10418.1 response regulator [Opitutaceae bacterium]
MIHSDPPPSVPKSRALLVVDDQASVRLSLEFMLSGVGFRVLSAASGPEAIEQMAREGADGALIDVHMPVMNGFETGVRLKELAAMAGRQFPIWFMTGAGGSAVEKRSAELGALGVFSKPFDLQHLLARLQSGFEHGTAN